MRLTIVTPCRNAEDWIGDTVRSICEQTFLDLPGSSVEYTLVDGASTDATLQRAREAWNPHPHATFSVISEPDQGMYDALAKGLERSTGDVVAYLNAGDYYSRYALEVVAECFSRLGVQWLTGMRVTYSDRGALISSKVPWKYSSRLVRAGHYGVRGRGRFIQQESTFWSRDLLGLVDYDYLRSLRLAGDLYLWSRFAERAELQIVSAHLGGFRFHGRHLSDAMDSYVEEARRFLRPPVLGGYVRTPLHEALSWLPVPVRGRVPGRPPVIHWQRASGTWEFL